MNQKTVAMIHTVSSLVPVFDSLGRELLKDTKIIHIADEAVLTMVNKAQGLTKEITRRVCDDAIAAEAADVDLVLLTCSSISPCADVAAFLCSIPVLKVDQAMIEEAISLSDSIGIIATAKTTLTPTISQINQYADKLSKKVSVKSYLCEEAFKALQAKDVEKHDELVVSEIKRAMNENSVIILAQASMARALSKMDKSSIKKPVLTSPERAVRLVQKRLNDL